MKLFKKKKWCVKKSVTVCAYAIGFAYSIAILPTSYAAEKSPPKEEVQIDLINAQGKTVGEAKLEQLEKGVMIIVDVKGLQPGEHGMHLHEKGVCKAPDFKSAGEHFNPKDKKHGYDVAKGPHAGDLPNLIVSKDGSAHVEVLNPNVTLSKGPDSLLKSNGTALVIHTNPDNYESQPSGDAGGRLACGEIRAVS